MYIESVRYSISGVTITRNSGARWRIATGGANSTRTALTTSNQNTQIFKVVGYK